MGYYSKVYIVVPVEDMGTMDEFLDGGLGYWQQKTFTIGGKPFQFYWSEETLKWYDAYCEVKSVNNFIKAETYDEGKGKGRAMFTIGEDGEVDDGVGDWPSLFKLETKVVDADLNYSKAKDKHPLKVLQTKK